MHAGEKLDTDLESAAQTLSNLHVSLRGYKGPVKKAYVHRASKTLNPLDILLYMLVCSLNFPCRPVLCEI
jgi:hypothetical protein